MPHSHKDSPLPSLLPSNYVLCFATVLSALLLGLLYKRSILAALNAYMQAKLPSIPLLISKKSFWRSTKTTEISIPASSQDTKFRPPDSTKPTLNKKSNGPLISRPSDSRDRDKPNIDANLKSKPCNNVSMEKYQQECMTSTSSENHRVEQPVAVERKTIGVVRSSAEVEASMSPNSPVIDLSQTCPFANATKEQAHSIDIRVQSAATFVNLTESDNDTVTSEDAHPSPPDSPIPTYKNRAALSFECSTDATCITTKRRRRRTRKSKTAQSPSRTPIPGEVIHIQQPSPRPSPDANLNTYRPTPASHLSPPQGYPPLYFQPHTERRTAPRPLSTTRTPDIRLPTYPTYEKPAATNVQPSYSGPPPPRILVTRSPLSEKNSPSMVPESTAFQRAADGENANERKVPSRPWSPFASGLNIELGSQIRTENVKYLNDIYQRSSSSTGGSTFNSRSHNSSLPILEDNVDQRFRQCGSASLFSHPNPSYKLNPSSSPRVSQPAFSRTPTAPVPKNGGRTANPWESHSTRQFSFFDKHLTFSSAEER